MNEELITLSMTRMKDKVEELAANNCLNFVLENCKAYAVDVLEGLANKDYKIETEMEVKTQRLVEELNIVHHLYISDIEMRITEVFEKNSYGNGNFYMKFAFKNQEDRKQYNHYYSAKVKNDEISNKFQMFAWLVKNIKLEVSNEILEKSMKIL